MMRPRLLLLVALAAIAGAVVVVLPALAAATSEAKLEVNENCVENDWPCWAAPGSGSKPEPVSKVTIAAGGEITFTDASATKASIAWLSAAPTCSPGVPISPAPARSAWEGTCKFELPGTYRFESATLFDGGPSLNYTEYEIVVESASGVTTPTTTSTPTATTPTTTTTSSTAPVEPSHGSPLTERSAALELVAGQHGTTVHGSIEVRQASSGGQLEVGLFTTGTSPGGPSHLRLIRIGRLVRSSLQAGAVSFSVPLSARGRVLLRRRRHLELTVRVTLTAPHSAVLTITRSFVVHASL